MTHPWMPVAGMAASSLAATWRWEVRGYEHVGATRAAGERIIFAPWHATMIPLVWRHRGQDITLLVSEHGDGGLLAGIAHRWGYRIVRGSSTRGGSRGYRLLLRNLAAGSDAGLTPDGPRGPAGRVKAGVLAAARRSRAAIIPVAAHATPAWRVNSWDQMLIPRPFARVRVVYGAPLRVAPLASLEDARTALEQRLGAVSDEAAA